MVQRYSMKQWNDSPSNDGEFVLFIDHQAEVDRLNKIIAKLEVTNDLWYAANALNQAKDRIVISAPAKGILGMSSAIYGSQDDVIMIQCEEIKS